MTPALQREITDRIFLGAGSDQSFAGGRSGGHWPHVQALPAQDGQADLGVEDSEEDDGDAEQREQEDVVDGRVDGPTHWVVSGTVVPLQDVPVQVPYDSFPGDGRMQVIN